MKSVIEASGEASPIFSLHVIANLNDYHHSILKKFIVLEIFA